MWNLNKACPLTHQGSADTATTQLCVQTPSARGLEEKEMQVLAPEA